MKTTFKDCFPKACESAQRKKNLIGIGWTMTDSDSLQYVKKLDDRDFLFVQASYIRHIDGEPEYGVYESGVNLDFHDYTTVCDCLDAYSFDDEYRKQLVNTYLDSSYTGDDLQVVAECIFECLIPTERAIYYGTKEECAEYIKGFVANR